MERNQLSFHSILSMQGYSQEMLNSIQEKIDLPMLQVSNMFFSSVGIFNSRKTTDTFILLT